jgi:hypothetical protein
MQKEIKINLESFIEDSETALVGRLDGEVLLIKLIKEKYVFKVLEIEYEKITIIIPNRIVSINKSYFLGLFETRIVDLGKKEFLKKYKFITTDHISEKIKRF